MKLIFENAMILAAGFGQRMLPLTLKVPKPLVHVDNKPLIFHTIDKLRNEKVKNILINTHYLSKKLTTAVKSKYADIGILYEKEILETGGGVFNALKSNFFINPHTPILVINGDIFWIENDESLFSQISNVWNNDLMDVLLVLEHKEKLKGYSGNGDFCFKNKKNEIGKITRKTKNDFVFCGIQILHPRVFREIKYKKFSLKEIYLSLIKSGRIYGTIDNNTWFHISTPEDLNYVNRWLKKK